MIKGRLEQIITEALVELEKCGEIVVCSDKPTTAATYIYKKVLSLVPDQAVSERELSAVRMLIFYAINDQRFFDWEMPTLTGLQAEEFRQLAEKLPKG